MSMSAGSLISRVIPWLLLVFAPLNAVAQVAWAKSFDAALKQAAEEKKFIILDISASS